MENRKELLDYAISQLIKLAMQELGETPEEDAAEERKGKISDQISRDTRLSGEQRALLLECCSLLEGLAYRRLRHIYCQGLFENWQCAQRRGVLAAGKQF